MNTAQAEKQQIVEKIQRLKNERNAVILAHNYQIGDVQDIADYVEDSFGLSRIAAHSEADIIVFCGVHFMAESAAILAPHKTVLLPEVLAGCPMADMVTAEALREKKHEHPNAVVVTYVNSSAAVKAESDICVTSANAVNVVNSLDAEEILFVPDMNLGHFVSERTDKKMIIWKGFCLTHHKVRAADVAKARKYHPDALVIVHPECRPEVVSAADSAFSTGGILAFVKQSEHKKFVIGTEMGLLHRLEKENPDKEFYLLHQGLICPNMKCTTLDKVAHALENMKTVISVEQSLREPARQALERMLAVE